MSKLLLNLWMLIGIDDDDDDDVALDWIRVVNGALEYLAKDLGIADNAVLQGKYLIDFSYSPSAYNR